VPFFVNLLIDIRKDARNERIHFWKTSIDLYEREHGKSIVIPKDKINIALPKER
jgi:hypothetical protein